MKTLACAVLALSLLAVPAARFAAQETDEAVKKELDSFQGKWQATGFIIAGVPAPDDQVQKTTMTVKGDTFTLKTAQNTSEGTIKLDPSQSPKAIDVVLTGPDGNKSELLGIYQTEGETRKSCFGLPNVGRPDGFRQQQGYVILEWKKVAGK